MKIATYNIQNLFHRHNDLIKQKTEIKLEQWNNEFETLRFKQNRKDSDYRRMRELAEFLSLHNSSDSIKLVTSDLKSFNNSNTVLIPENAVQNKIKVVAQSNPDILLLQEVESRASLIQFNQLIFKEELQNYYKEIIHLDGNDARGLGMGILLKEGYRIRAIQSFSSERDFDGSFLFTNDLQSYKIETPLGQFIYVLCVQLTSDSMDRKFIEKRTRQAKMVSQVYEELRLGGNEMILVLGTLNAPKYSKSISPILKTDMINIAELSNFEVALDTGIDSGYYRMGAYRKGVNVKQNDYLLASPAMKDRIYGSGMNRKAIWPLKRPEWDTYDSMQNEKDAASEHPLLWADFKLEQPIYHLKKSA